MWSWLVGATGSAIEDHVSGRDQNWWTGPNSVWGRITGGAGEDAGVTVSTWRPEYEEGNNTPLIIGAVVLLYLFNK